MKILKSILSGIFWLLIIALMVAPLGIIYQISQEEMKQYETPEVPKLVETAMGQIVQATSQEVAEYVKLSGTFTSTTYAYQELEYKNPGTIRWLVSTGDEVQAGQVIGSYNGEDVTAAQTGMLVEIDTYSTDAYLRYRLFTPVELECRVSEELLQVLQVSHNLTTEDGEAITVTYVSRQRNADGTTDIRLSIDSDKYAYGQVVEGMNVLTGNVYRAPAVLPVECVYQEYVSEDSDWYVRVVTEDGVVVGSQKVEVGYSNGDLICIEEGLAPGTYCDAGYKAVMGG